MSVVLMEGKMNTKKNERFAETDRRIRKAFTKMVLNKKTNQRLQLPSPNHPP